MTVHRKMLVASVLTSAVALAVAGSATSAAAGMNPKMEKKLNHMLKMHPGASKAAIEANMHRVAVNHLVRCYGINAVAKNDCASGAHSCAGQATQARDPSAFVLLPAGDCGKIAGGSLKGPM